jgi:hypothetical protein
MIPSESGLTADTPAGTLLYLYCILDADSAAVRLLDQRQVEGVEPGEPLFAVRSGGLVAAASFVPASMFEEEPLNQLLGDLPRLAPYAIRHEQAIRSLLDHAPALIPMTFGAIYRSAQRLVAILDERTDDFHSRLERLRNQQEWELKVFRRPDDLLAALVRRSEANLSEPPGSGPGRAYLSARLRERRMGLEVAERSVVVAEALCSALETMSSGLRAETLAGENSGGAELIYRIAALVARPKTEDFLTLVTDLEREYEPEGFSLDLTGPWAPYSFVEWGSRDAD